MRDPAILRMTHAGAVAHRELRRILPVIRRRLNRAFGSLDRFFWELESAYRKLRFARQWKVGNSIASHQLRNLMAHDLWVVHWKRAYIFTYRPIFARSVNLPESAPVITKFAGSVAATTTRVQPLRSSGRDWNRDLISSFEADLLVPRAGGTIMFVNSRTNRVLRESHSLHQDYVRLRSAYATCVQSVPFSWSETLDAPTEPVLFASDLTNYDLRTRRRIRQRILTDYKCLFENSIPQIQPCMRSLADLHPGMEEVRYRWADISRLVDNSPIVVSHGDFHDVNILLTDETDYRVCDFDTIGLRPFWTDVVSLALGDISGLVAGLYDGNFSLLWQAAGIQQLDMNTDTRRLLLLLGATLQINRELRQVQPGTWRWKAAINRHASTWERRLNYR